MIETSLTAELLHGCDHTVTTARGLKPHRLPGWVAAQCPDPRLMTMEEQPSGVRVTLRTEAQCVELVTHSTYMTYKGFDRPRGAIDLVIDGRLVGSDPLTGGDITEVDLQTGGFEVAEGASHLTRFADLEPGVKLVELWLPHNEAIELIGLRTDAPVASVPAGGRRWVHHGSSISQGSNAATPGRTWPALAARRGGVELRNLGMGGSSMVDPFMARVMRDAPADLLSVNFGINVVNADAMRLRAFVPAVHGFLDTIRDGHPTTPLLLVSPTYCEIHEDTPGPGAFDPSSFTTGEVKFRAAGTPGDTELGRLTLSVVREALSAVVESRDDPHLFYLDGTSLYSSDDAAEHPLTDGLHPDTVTHDLIGTRFARQVFGAGGSFAKSNAEVVSRT